MIVRLACAFTSLLCLAAPFASANESFVTDTLEAWQQKRDAVPTAHYIVNSDVTIPARTFVTEDDALPVSDYTYTASYDYTLSVAEGSFRNETTDQVFNEQASAFRPRYIVSLYDGLALQRFKPNDRNTSDVYTPTPIQPQLEVRTTSTHTMLLNQGLMPLWHAHGIVIPSGHATMSSDFLRNSIVTKEQLAYHGPRSDGVFVLRTVGVMEQPYIDEYVIDSGKRYSIVQWSRIINGEVRAVVDIAHQEQDGFWIPFEWTVASQLGGRARRTSFAVASHAYRHTSDTEFSVDPEDNSVVVQDGDFYKVADGGQTSKTTVPKLVDSHYRFRGNLARICVVVIALITGAVIVIGLRWRSR